MNMFKNIVTTLFVACGIQFFGSASLKAELVKMPDYGTLKKIISDLGLNEFDQKTGVVGKLAGREVCPSDVQVIKHEAIRDYCKYFPFPPDSLGHLNLRVQANGFFDMFLRELIDFLVKKYPQKESILVTFMNVCLYVEDLNIGLNF